MKLFDCHCHTDRSACGRVPLEWYHQIATEAPCSFAITDHSAHIYYPPEDKWAFWTDRGQEAYERYKQWGDRQLEQYIVDVRAAQRGSMYLGLELDIFLDGTPVCDERYLSEFDVLLGAPHTFPAVENEAPVEQVEAEFKQIIRGLLALEVHVVVHPFRVLVQKGYTVSESLIEWTVDICGEHGVALEINSGYKCYDEDIVMADLAIARGVTLALGTDTHGTDRFGIFTYHYEIADRVGIPAEKLYWQPQVVVAQAAQ